MKIQTLVNFKLNNGNILLKGIHDDSEKPFPEELMDEIEANRNPKIIKKKLIVLVEDNKRPVPTPAKKTEPAEDEVNTLDNEEDVITTDVRRKRKIKK